MVLKSLVEQNGLCSMQEFRSRNKGNFASRALKRKSFYPACLQEIRIHLPAQSNTELCMGIIIRGMMATAEELISQIAA